MAASVQWGHRPDGPASIALTSRDLRLLALLADVNFLSTSQLVVLGWGLTGERAGQKRLKRLHDAGYVDRFRPACATGSAEWNYRLTLRGSSALDSRSANRAPAYSPAVITNLSYTEHDIQLASLVIHVALATRGDSRGGPLLDAMPFEWIGPRSGRIDPASARRAPHAESPAPEGLRLHFEQSRAGYLEPDATLIACDSNGLKRAVLIEYDRTNRPHKQQDRLRRYDRWLLDGWRRGGFAAHAAPPAVIFLTARDAPLRRLIETADSTLTAWSGRPDAGPREGAHPARQRIVFTSRDRLLALDWTMFRAPRLPPAFREDRECSPRPVGYDLSELLSESPAASAEP